MHVGAPESPRIPKPETTPPDVPASRCHRIPRLFGEYVHMPWQRDFGPGDSADVAQGETTVRRIRWLSLSKPPTGNAIRRFVSAVETTVRHSQDVARMSFMSWAVSEGVLPTLTPTASRASFFACAVPDEPETIAPA